MLRVALKSLLSSAVRWQGVLAALLYGVCSTTMAFVNKAVLSSYRFNFPFFILSIQMALTIAVLELLCWRRVLSLPRYTLKAGLSFLWPSLFCGLHGALSLYALHGLNIPMYGAVKRCTPLVNLILSVTLLRKGAPSLLLASSILIITGGCFIAALGDLTYDPAAYTLGLLSVLAQGLYLTLVQRHSEVTGSSSFLILQLNSYNSLLPFVLFSFAAGEPLKAISMTCWNDPRFVMLFTLLVVLGCVFTYSLFVCTSVNSALTTSLVGVAKSTIQTVLGFFAFGGVKYHPLNITGICINTFGGFVYAYAKYTEKKPAPGVVKDQNLNIVHDKETLLGQHRMNGLPRIIASPDVTDNSLIEVRIT